MNKYTIMSKAIGAAAAGIILVDSFDDAKQASRREQVRITANSLPDAYVNSNRLNSQSRIGNDLKKSFFDWRLGNGIPEFFAGIGGFFKGGVEHLTQSIIPVGLAAGALMFKKAGRFCAAGLALMGVKFLVNDVMGVGKPKPLKDDF